MNINSLKNPKGYRKTELGIIPENWRIEKLEEFCYIKTGPFGAQLHQSDYVEQGTPIITVEHLSDMGILHQNIPLVSNSDKKRLAQYILKTGDIVFSRVGWVDRNSLVTEKENGWLFSGRLLRIRPRDKTINTSFLSHYFHSTDFRKRIKRVAVGGTMPCLNTALLSGMLVIIPPHDEQDYISQILSTWDRAIEQVQRLIEAKQSQKKGLMQGLLTGRLRFPEFGKPVHKKDEIPNEWSLVKFNQIGLLKAGGTPSTFVSQYWGGEIPWMNSGELNLKFVNSVNGRITESGMKNSNTSMVPRHSVLVGLAGQGKTRGTVAVNEIPLCTNQSIAAIMPKEQRADYLYLYYNLDSRYQELRRMSAGDGGRGGLTLSILGNMHVTLPKIEEQLQIAQCLFLIDQNIMVLESKKQMLNRQKEGLMQKLLTGEIRVK